jgi:hypothetical protein
MSEKMVDPLNGNCKRNQTFFSYSFPTFCVGKQMGRKGKM